MENVTVTITIVSAKFRGLCDYFHYTSNTIVYWFWEHLKISLYNSLILCDKISSCFAKVWKRMLQDWYNFWSSLWKRDLSEYYLSSTMITTGHEIRNLCWLDNVLPLLYFQRFLTGHFERTFLQTLLRDLL